MVVTTVSIIMNCFATLVFLAVANLSNAQKTSDGKIVGGTAVDIEKYPYQLSLQLKGKHYCGASIISDRWAVTAAHCSKNHPVDAMSLRAGSSIRESGGTVNKVVQKIVHSLFDWDTVDYDIALLKVSTPFIFRKGVAIIALPFQNESVTTGAMCDITGWGVTNKYELLPTRLQATTVPVVSQAECQSLYSGIPITPRMICAGLVEKGGKDACQGDSGGPMVTGGKLVGISSWGSGCGEAHYPGVYSRVSSLRNWIKQNANV